MADEPGDDVYRSIRSTLVRTKIGLDLNDEIDRRHEDERKGKKSRQDAAGPYKVIIELNDRFPAGAKIARMVMLASYATNHPVERMPDGERPAVRAAIEYPEQYWVEPDLFDRDDRLAIEKSMYSAGYLFGELSLATINRLADAEVGKRGHKVPLVYKLWHNHTVRGLIFESSRTIKGDAARATFAAGGDKIVWAVADTGIDKRHRHFDTYKTLELRDGLMHRDFTVEHASPEKAAAAALVDNAGHGTHVAGIIAGETPEGSKFTFALEQRVHSGSGTKPVKPDKREDKISGIAPRCKILSLKVLETRDDGDVASLIAAIGYIQQLNEYGRNVKVHGLNLSLGYSSDPAWFGAGQSPLCSEVNRLVRSGVVVVAAAGNSGMTIVTTASGGSARAAQHGTIADPANADLAITVGSTHRDSPHTYGISYFSGKGPTADGRMKPDLVAPGERIISCALVTNASTTDAPFVEDSGTSMAAPHVSGAAAAFLSVRREFIGQPDRVKSILVRSATDLGRRPEFQGAGLVDLMRALQTV